MPELLVLERELVVPPSELYVPKQLLTPFPKEFDEKLIGNMHNELADRALELIAKGDPDGAYGYFPHSGWANNEGLTHCKEFERRYGVIGEPGDEHYLTFILLALKGLDPLGEKVHLDVAKDADELLTEQGKRDKRFKLSRWLGSFGLSDTSMTASGQNPDELCYTRSGNHLKPVKPDESQFEEIELKGRKGPIVNCVRFLGSEMLHGGANDPRFSVLWTRETQVAA